MRIQFRSSSAKSAHRGFTLVELMVALTGGLFMAVVVFTLAKDASRFYTREARVADATLAAIAGFERLRSDLSRIAFMSSPNIRLDPRRCGDPVGDPTWPVELKRLAGLRIDTETTDPAPTAPLVANGLAPDSIVIAGSLSSVDEFPMSGVQLVGSEYQVRLQTSIGPLARQTPQSYNALDAAGQTALLRNVFTPNGTVGRALRIVDQSGAVQYGTISGVDRNGPIVKLSMTPNLVMRSGNATTCGLTALSTGYVNVVNFVRYQVRPINLTTSPGYKALLDSTTPWDAGRTELIREELDVTGTPIPNTEEVVAEYAVDLKFGITVAQTLNGTSVAQLQSFAPGAAAVEAWAGDVSTGPTILPERIQVLRVRLSVRSREADRELGIATGGNVAPGLYRFQLANSAGKVQFARVRTLQADIVLNNQAGTPW